MAEQPPANALDAWMAHIDQAQPERPSRARELMQKAQEERSQPPRPATGQGK